MTLAPRSLPAVRDVVLGAAAFVFDGCLRVSEALGLRPVDLVRGDGGWSARIVGKGGKAGQVALSSSLVAQLHAHAYQLELPRDAAFFPVTRVRVHQIVSDALGASGIGKPDHVGLSYGQAVHRGHHSSKVTDRA